MNKNDRCAICLDPSVSNVKLLCGHRLHLFCAIRAREGHLQWTNRPDFKCPYCRRESYFCGICTHNFGSAWKLYVHVITEHFNRAVCCNENCFETFNDVVERDIHSSNPHHQAVTYRRHLGAVAGLSRNYKISIIPNERPVEPPVVDLSQDGE